MDSSFNPRSPYASVEIPDDENCIPCLEKTSCEENETSCKTEYTGYQGYAMNNSVAYLIVWFLVIFVVTILALYSLRPTFVLKKHKDKVDNGKVIISSFIIAVLIVLLIWLIQAISGRK